MGIKMHHIHSVQTQISWCQYWIGKSVPIHNIALLALHKPGIEIGFKDVQNHSTTQMWYCQVAALRLSLSLSLRGQGGLCLLRRLQHQEALQGEDTSAVIVLSGREREGDSGERREGERERERESKAAFSGSLESLVHTRCWRMSRRSRLRARQLVSSWGESGTWA